MGLFCVLFLLSGCHKKTPESQSDSHREQIQEVSQKAEKAALQAEQDQDQAESKLAEVKEMANQVMTQDKSGSDKSILQDARAAAEASTKASQSAGAQAETAGQCAKEIDSLMAASDKETGDHSADSSMSKKARTTAQNSQKRAQVSYNQAQKTSELAQEYLELTEQASKTISKSEKTIESAHRAISSGIQDAQNRQSIEDAIEELENMQTVLGESISYRSPEEITQLLDQLETASDSLVELLALRDDFKGTGTEPTLSPPMAEEGRSSGKSSQISSGQIPGLPTPPNIIRTPSGAFETPELPVEDTNHSTGKWVQSKGGNGPDFLPGNYSTSELDFKVNGVLEVKRTFGENNEITVRWRVGYEWNNDRSFLTLGKEPQKRPLPSSLTGFSVSEFDISAKAAVLPFPATIDAKQIDKNRLQIGPKIYRRSIPKK
ncbi:MAG: hypothetical protein DRP56_04640 [Planctomycetota bacterium]|nr:MAG: hypothetical protein DRP56_04640 [Planctomycetota bacterium]